MDGAEEDAVGARALLEGLDEASAAFISGGESSGSENFFSFVLFEGKHIPRVPYDVVVWPMTQQTAPVICILLATHYPHIPHGKKNLEIIDRVPGGVVRTATNG